MTSSAEIEAFAERVRRYTRFVEAASSIPLTERVRVARNLVADLVAGAARLPECGDDDEDGEERQGADRPAGWPGLGQYDAYWEVFDPYEQAEPVASSVSLDIIEIYQDVRGPLLAYEAGRIDAAVWEWRFAFETHWGHHAVDALRTLHRACERSGAPG